MKSIINFKKFESKEYNDYIDYPTIEEIFIELIDVGYKMEYFELEKGQYFFEFKKADFSDQFEPIELPPACYGWGDLDGIKNEFDILINVLKESKYRLNSMGYDIAFQIEYSMDLILASCKMQHKSLSE